MAKGAEWRRVENETVDGPEQSRTDASYVFGAEIDGVFVPVVTKSAGYVDALVARGRETQDAEQGTSADTSAKGSTSGSGQ